MSAETIDVLRKARGLIAKPGAWIQCAFAMNADGKTVSPRDPSATCWCADGALVSVAGSYRAGEAHRVLTRATGVLIPAWNDAPGRTQAQVVAAFDKAIASAGPAHAG